MLESGRMKTVVDERCGDPINMESHHERIRGGRRDGVAMSCSTGSSSAPGFRRASGRRGTDSRSPIPYREGAMSYDPSVFYWCDPPRKAPRWISWSKQNPGRWYYSCVDAMHGGCGFVSWHDAELPKFFSDLIGDLRDEVWKLKGGRNVAPIEEFTADVQDEHEVAANRMVQMLQDQVALQNAELKAPKGKYKTVVFGFVVFVLGLLIGRMVLK
ncbi:unnamed protein product [Alopecurus aequalis]